MSAFGRFPQRLQEAIVSRLGFTGLRPVQELAALALLEEGYRPRTSFLRLTRQGVPERADTRRCYLTSWR